MTKKYGGLQYVKDFSFPSECGFTGSAGKSEVKGYMRGGKVKGRNTPNKHAKRAKGTTAAAMGGYMGPEREITVDDVKITTPARMKGGGAVEAARTRAMFTAAHAGKPIKKPSRGAKKMRVKGAEQKRLDRARSKGMSKKGMPKNVKAKGGSVHDKLYAEGGKMGYAQGGQVKVRDSIGNDPTDIGRTKYDRSPKDKNTSSQFKQKRKKQATRDSGVVPANKGSTSQEREAGGRGRLKPGFAVGGLAKAAGAGAKVAGRAVGRAAKMAKRVARSGGRGMGEMKPSGPNTHVKDTSKRRATRAKSPDKTKGKGMVRKGMPKNVKAKGGKVGYATGGVVGKNGAAQ